jgi:hypothetical protein
MKTRIDRFVDKLRREERDSVTRVIAFMSYIPSIGRVLQKGGVKEFQKMMLRLVSRLPSVRDSNTFDTLHDEYVLKITEKLQTSRRGRPAYGQAQKPINVFLKVFVDWAGRPEEETRERLIPYLHVPLDSIVMKEIKRVDRGWYDENVKPRLKSRQQEFSLSKIDRNLYLAWQHFFRERHPEKPLIFDVAWELGRR